MIDVHAHAGVPSAEQFAAGCAGFDHHRAAVASRYQNLMTAEYMRSIAGESDRLLTNVDVRLESMDRSGVQTQVISVNPGQYYYWANHDAARALVEIVNLHLADLVRAHPSRFLALGTVALQHPALAAEQLHYAIHELGLAGVQISTNAGGRDLSAPEFDELWAAADECDAVVFIHPLGCPQLTDRLAPSYLNNIIGQPLETTIALSHLIFGGVLDRHPDLRIVAAHGGGYLPFYLGRSEHAYTARPDSHSMMQPPGYYLRRMWFDTVVGSPLVLANLCATVGASQLVIGSDYPFDMGSRRPGDIVDALPDIDETARNAIRTDNALALLGRHAFHLGATAIDRS
jgi:aminocarboxymuconate-semialdehyde decarboxylase